MRADGKIPEFRHPVNNYHVYNFTVSKTERQPRAR
jgi:hypothetical protein